MDSLREINSKLRNSENSVENSAGTMYTYSGPSLLDRLKEIVRRRKENKERGRTVLHFDCRGYIARIEDEVVY